MQDNESKEHTNAECGLAGFGLGNKSKTGAGFMNLLMYLGDLKKINPIFPMDLFLKFLLSG